MKQNGTSLKNGFVSDLFLKNGKSREVLSRLSLEKKKKGLCMTKYCRHRVTKRERESSHYYCSKCRSRRFKERHPEKYHFNLLRCAAKQRKKVFELTFEHFKEVWENSGFEIGSGREKESPTIDRIDNTLGYVNGNIRIIPKIDNSKKGVNSLEEECPF